MRLFGDTVLPVVSPAFLKKSARPLLRPADLVHHILLAYEDEKQGKLVAPLPQRFANPRSCYLLLADRAAANPAVDAFRQWLAAQVKSGAGRTKLLP